VDEKQLKAILTKLKKIDPKVIAISIIDDESIKKVQKLLNTIKAKK